MKIKIRFRNVIKLLSVLIFLSVLAMFSISKPQPIPYIQNFNLLVHDRIEHHAEQLQEHLPVVDKQNNIASNKLKTMTSVPYISTSVNDRIKRENRNGVSRSAAKPGSQKTGSEDDKELPNYFLYLQRSKINNHSGPGEYGGPVIVKRENLSIAEKEEYDIGWKNGFNQYASDRISLDRTLKDPRDEECKNIQYGSDLPKASVIIIFQNEAWSVLLRSVHSIINRTPPQLLEEIILVDDFSTLSHLKRPLDDYMVRLKVIKIVRAKQREGLIRARLLGYKAAKGPVLIFLDSHIECAVGWIEPLLSRIGENQNISVTPVIDTIDDQTLEFKFQNAKATNVGGFDWSLTFTWHGIPEDERRRRHYKDYVPVRSPTMAGGLFAISKDFFYQIGTYDEGMEIWGAENLELSFRIWQCGGILETAPCSHVGHIFRKKTPIKSHLNTNTFLYNNLRMAEVWLDDYKFYYYQHIKNRTIKYGDITSRRNIKEQLKCKPFEWFIVHVYPELFIPGESSAYGQIRNKQFNVCMKGSAGYGKISEEIKLETCNSEDTDQVWYLTRDKEIRLQYGCIDAAGFGKVIVFACHGQRGNQQWTYAEDNTLRTGLGHNCIGISLDGKKLTMEPCQGLGRQIWSWTRGKPPGPVPNRNK